MSITTIKTQTTNLGTETLSTVKFTGRLHIHIGTCGIFRLSKVFENLCPVLSYNTEHHMDVTLTIALHSCYHAS